MYAARSTVATRSSMASLGMGRSAIVISTPVRTFEASNAWRLPSRLITITADGRSNVVKRCPQCGHALRRRIVRPSSAGLESTTLVSSDVQSGQRILTGYRLQVSGHRSQETKRTGLRLSQEDVTGISMTCPAWSRPPSIPFNFSMTAITRRGSESAGPCSLAISHNVSPGWTR